HALPSHHHRRGTAPQSRRDLGERRGQCTPLARHRIRRLAQFGAHAPGIGLAGDIIHLATGSGKTNLILINAANLGSVAAFASMHMATNTERSSPRYTGIDS